jgi:tRNA pseudouridine38-40 synthase
MQYYHIIVAYDGTNFFGWQSQKTGKTIVQTMQHCFFKTFQAQCTVLGVSRTDSGVHAEGQVALVTTELNIDPKRLQKAWNKSLPLSIMIKECQSVTADYNPFVGIVSKTYQYTIYKKRPLPFIAHFGWYYPFIINEKIFKNALSLFVGKHDFSAFSPFEPGINTVRTIDNIEIKSDESNIVVTISGKSFIRHMIRRIVGAAVVVSTKQTRTIDDIVRLLHTKDTTGYCFQTAPACGLCLIEIHYKK